MVQGWFAAGAIAAGLGVVLGAFGAHALKTRVDASMLAAWQTGVQYHLVHALALLAVAWFASRWPGTAVTAAGWSFLVGIVLFSGSLYAMTLTGVRGLGTITPLGGLAFIGGWALLALAALRS